eukprot:EG_transcript_14938
MPVQKELQAGAVTTPLGSAWGNGVRRGSTPAKVAETAQSWRQSNAAKMLFCQTREAFGLHRSAGQAPMVIQDPKPSHAQSKSPDTGSWRALILQRQRGGQRRERNLC